MPTISQLKNPHLEICKIVNDVCICKGCWHTCSECATCLRLQETEGKIKCPYPITARAYQTFMNGMNGVN